MELIGPPRNADTKSESTTIFIEHLRVHLSGVRGNICWLSCVKLSGIVWTVDVKHSKSERNSNLIYDDVARGISRHFSTFRPSMLTPEIRWLWMTQLMTPHGTINQSHATLSQCSCYHSVQVCLVDFEVIHGAQIDSVRSNRRWNSHLHAGEMIRRRQASLSGYLTRAVLSFSLNEMSIDVASERFPSPTSDIIVILHKSVFNHLPKKYFQTVDMERVVWATHTRPPPHFPNFKITIRRKIRRRFSFGRFELITRLPSIKIVHLMFSGRA